MFAFRDRLSLRARYWWGFCCAPFFVWLVQGAQLLFLLHWENELEPWANTHSDITTVLFVLGLLTISYGCVTTFAGFAAAFFLGELRDDASRKNKIALWSVVLAWLPSLFWMLCFGLFLFLILLYLYHVALERGYLFWESNDPRQFLGDFSGPIGDDKG